MKSLRKFKHVNATTVEGAVSLLRLYGDKAWVIAGGTDLLGTMRFEVLRNYPEVVVNLKTIPGLNYIKEEDGFLKIGALTRLEDISRNLIAKNRYPALAEAAHRAASPHVREMGTIGGNICQLIRCWYFRTEDNRFDCIRKGGATCFASIGDNRYHSIFGATRVASPPCIVNCPAANDIPSFLSSLRSGDITEAAQILLDSNPLPAITGRVCPHACEKYCNRQELDEALSIRSIERYLGDYSLGHSAELYQSPKRESKKKVAVVGAGPAGLAAAFYLRKLGYGVTVLDSREESGGILAFGIPPYRLPKDIVKKQLKAIMDMGVQFKFKVNVGKDVTLDELQRDYAAVFCATGAWQQSKLGVADESLLTPALDFLARVNRRLKKLTAQKVLVIGGGSVAIDVATSALRLGSKEVTMVCLESREEMPAPAEEVEQALKEGLKLMTSWGPAKVLKVNGKLGGMELVRCTSVFNREGRFAPTYDNSIKEKVEADQVILAIGQKPDLSYAGKKLEIALGLIKVDSETQATNLEGVFAGGDATTSGALSVVAAVASGRRAAFAINRYLGGKATLNTRHKVEHLTRCEDDCLQKQNRIKTTALELSELSIEKEDITGIGGDAVEIEVNRCLNCGCDGVNPSDMAAVLVALDARIITPRRTIMAEEFWVADKGLKPTALDNDEIITEIKIPTPTPGLKSAFIKFALRKSIDFPIVNCAAAVQSEGGEVKSARICLNAVYSNPYRAIKAEESIIGKKIDEASAEAAGEAAVSDAVALPYNKYKIQIAKTLVKRTILACQ